MRKGLLFSLFSLFFLFTCACVPDGHIRRMPFRTVIGLVIDSNRAAVTSAMVTTDPPTSTSLTDDLGKFILTNLPEGTYTIQVAKPGFAANSTIIAIKGLGPFHVDVQLAKKIITSPGEQEKLLPKIHYKEEEKGEEDGGSWWPTK